VAKLIHRIRRFYGDSFCPDTTIGVIVPYRHQIGLIRQELGSYGDEVLFRVSIDTVERYQGSQRDVIIYSFAVSHHYQLDFLTASTIVENGQPIDRKLNVAMTRARRQLIMTGRRDLLCHEPLFKEIIQQYETTDLGAF
jgi:superfamily I DNA and/or RNA helicase